MYAAVRFSWQGVKALVLPWRVGRARALSRRSWLATCSPNRGLSFVSVCPAETFALGEGAVEYRTQQLKRVSALYRKQANADFGKELRERTTCLTYVPSASFGVSSRWVMSVSWCSVLCVRVLT